VNRIGEEKDLEILKRLVPEKFWKWKRVFRKDTSIKGLGLCYRVQRRVHTKKGKSVLLSQSLDDLGTTRGEYLGRTRWSSPLDLTIYLYYFTSGCTPIITQSHILPEHSMTLSHDMIT